MLIAGRSVMGAGGALIMPTTLSILVNVFGDPRERAKAIAAWTAASAAGIALGPIIGGALMRSFSWSSVFWINVPLLVAAIAGTMHLVPDSRDPHATRLDPIGAVLSIAAISTLVYAIVQAPEHGWTATSSMANFAVGSVLAVVFVAWALRRDPPMLGVSLFLGRGFSASLLTTGQLEVALLSAADVLALRDGRAPFDAFGPTDLNGLFAFGHYLLVCRPDFPAHHAYRVVQTLSENAAGIPGAMSVDATASPVAIHAGARAYALGEPMPMPITPAGDELMPPDHMH
jgi:MFS family permease